MTEITVTNEDFKAIIGKINGIVSNSDHFEDGTYQRVHDNEGDYEEGTTFVRLGYEQVEEGRFIPDYFESYGFEEDFDEVMTELAEAYPDIDFKSGAIWTNGVEKFTVVIIEL